MLKACYPGMFEIGLEHAPPNQFNDALRQYQVSGSTLEKARSFFLQAAKFAEITLSSGIQHFSKQGAPAGRIRRAVNGRNREEADEEDDIPEDPAPTPPQRGTSRTITLRGSGSATLSFDVDVWSMTPEDQGFVFEMINRMTEYEQKVKPAGGPAPK